MFAIAFDLDTNDTEDHHPKSVSQAYADIRATLDRFGFEWHQGSVYASDDENLGNLFAAMTALKALACFPASVRDIRAFRVVGLYEDHEVLTR